MRDGLLRYVHAASHALIDPDAQAWSILGDRADVSGPDIIRSRRDSPTDIRNSKPVGCEKTRRAWARQRKQLVISRDPGIRVVWRSSLMIRGAFVTMRSSTPHSLERLRLCPQ